MYDTKVLKKTGEKLVAYQSTWLVEDTIAVSELELCPRAVLKAPEGKFLTLTVNGVGRQIKPGTYKGDVVLSVTDAYHMEPGGLMRMNQIGREMNAAVVVADGKVTPSPPSCRGEKWPTARPRGSIWPVPRKALTALSCLAAASIPSRV